MRLAVLLLLVARVAAADELTDWVRQRVARQREAPPAAPAKAPAPAAPPQQPWRERGEAAPALPGFTPPTSLAPLVRAVRPGVVNISTRNESATRSLGSGFVIHPDGLVVTNSHVVDKATRILVRLADGATYEAEIAGRDAQTDLALLRLPKATGLPTVTLGDSDQLEVGDWVVAIGNPLGLETSVTHGLISARERVLGVGPFDDFIQTNALINPGNSGGPLFDMRGDVVGVTTAVMSQGQGIGFAVPINMVKELLPNLLANGSPARGWLGLNLKEIGEGAGRATVVLDVFAGSPADHAGIKPGDRVVAIGGKPVQRYQQVQRRVSVLAPGTRVQISVTRAGKPFEFSATLTRRPSEEAMRAMGAGRVEVLGMVLRAPEGQGAEPGLRVDALVPGGAAAAAGMALGDVVLEVNREAVAGIASLDAALRATPAGEPVLIKFRRGDSQRYLALRSAP